MNMNQVTNYLGISGPTIYAWKRNKPNLYNIVMKWKAKNENKEFKSSDINFTNKKDTDTTRLLKFYGELEVNEQKELLTELELKILRRKVENLEEKETE